MEGLIVAHETPIYISLTSIFKNQGLLKNTLDSILEQSQKPDKIFIYLSEDPSFHDEGFFNKKITHDGLKNTLAQHKKLIEIIWGKDIGPFGKLLPLLKQKWKENCLIITIDDDVIYHNTLIKNLLEDYLKYNCAISYRGFTPRFKKFEDFDYESRDEDHCLQKKNFATGKGSVLYAPWFFHKTKDLIFNEDIYPNTTKTNDDIWFYIIRVLNNIPCYINNKQKWQLKLQKSDGLWVNFNRRWKDGVNINTKLFRDTVKELKLRNLI
jgi:hypothetical protein